jgi:hypothetical protein
MQGLSFAAHEQRQALRRRWLTFHTNLRSIAQESVRAECVKAYMLRFDKLSANGG